MNDDDDRSHSCLPPHPLAFATHLHLPCTNHFSLPLASFPSIYKPVPKSSACSTHIPFGPLPFTHCSTFLSPFTAKLPFKGCLELPTVPPCIVFLTHCSHTCSPTTAQTLSRPPAKATGYPTHSRLSVLTLLKSTLSIPPSLLEPVLLLALVTARVQVLLPLSGPPPRSSSQAPPPLLKL